MKRYKHRISIWFGTTIELLGVSFGFFILSLTSILPYSILNLLLMLVAWFSFWFFSHCLAHFIVGKILGVNFLFYFVGKSSIIKLNLPVVSSFAKRVPVLGIKIDKASFQQVSARKRALMFASGVLASMIFPTICIVYSLMYMSIWMTIFFAVLSISNVLLTLFFSSKVGDLAKARATLHA